MGSRRKEEDHKVFTTGQVAWICRVSPRTASKWFDGGVLHGFRVPMSKDRRVIRADLAAFMREYGIPADRLPGGEYGGGRVLVIGGDDVSARMSGVADHRGVPMAVTTVGSEFAAGASLRDCLPDIVVAVGGVVSTRLFPPSIRGVQGCERLPLVLVGDENTTEPDVRSAVEAGWSAVVCPDGEPLATVVGRWRSFMLSPEKKQARKSKSPAR